MWLASGGICIAAEDAVLVMFTPQNILDEQDRLLIREEHVSKMIARRDIENKLL
jgi:hypothetical protein